MKIWEPKKEEVKEEIKISDLPLADPIYTLEEYGKDTLIKVKFHNGREQTVMILYHDFSFARQVLSIPDGTLRNVDCRLLYGKIGEI